RDRAYQDQVHRANCLHLLVAAIGAWTALRLILSVGKWLAWQRNAMREVCQLPPGSAAGLQHILEGCVHVAVPELLTKSQPACQVEDDLDVAASLAQRLDDLRPPLDMRHCLDRVPIAELQGRRLEVVGGR